MQLISLANANVILCCGATGLLITVRFMVFIPGARSHHQVWIIFVVDGQHTYARTSIQCSACLASCTWYCFCYNILSMSWYISVVSIWAGSVVPAWLFVSACLILKSRPFSTAFRVFMIYLGVNVVALNFLYVQCELLSPVDVVLMIDESPGYYILAEELLLNRINVNC